jgi:hypothetical protein
MPKNGICLQKFISYLNRYDFERKISLPITNRYRNNHAVMKNYSQFGCMYVVYLYVGDIYDAFLG